MRVGIVGFVGVLVVNLPSQDVGIVAESFRHLFSHFAGEFAIFLIRKIEMLPVAVFGLMAFFVDSQRLRIFLGKPSWRSRRRCADYSVDSMLPGGGDGAIHPVKIVLAFGRFHAAPGK